MGKLGLQQEGAAGAMARRMFELVEPIGVIPYSADEPNEAMFALGSPTTGTPTSPDGRRPWASPSGGGARSSTASLGEVTHSEGVAHHHTRSGDRRSPGGLREGVAEADPRRSRRLSRLRPLLNC